MTDRTASALHMLLVSNREVDGEHLNVVDGLIVIAESINKLARAVQDLGNGNAATSMGAIENLAVELRKGSETIADAMVEARRL